MTIAMRDRPDGQVEIVLYRAEIIGVMNDRDMATRFVAFLQQDEPELIEEEPSGFATAAADVADVAALDLDEVVPKPARRQAVKPRAANLPAIAAVRPQAPVFVAAPKDLSEAELEAAFDRIHAGEKLTSVAIELGITMGRLRGLWAAHRRYLQRHIAECGQQPCTLCKRPFTPSLSSPDTCARCSHG